MLLKISTLLINHQLTLKDIFQNQHLVEQDLRKALDESPDNWSSSVLSALSLSLSIRSGDLLGLLDPVYPLRTSDHSRMTQGIYIEDPEIYERIRPTVKSEHLESWQPDEEDILRLPDEVFNPSPIFQTEIGQTWGGEDD